MSLTKVSYSMINGAPANILDFGAVGDGVTDDTAAIQAAVDSGAKHIVIPYGAAGVYKQTNAIFFNSGGVTLEWENNNIQLKKFYNGASIVVNAGLITFVNPGINGNGDQGYTGSGIYYNNATYFTFDSAISNPRISNTQDSCILIKGPRGASGLVVTGGSLIPYNASGASSGGYPAVRMTGAQDGDVAPRKFIGVSSSAQPLIDFTGMWNTTVDNCFCGTMFFKGNPDVTGLPIQGTPYFTECAEVFISDTYIRNGMTVSGGEVLVENSLSHGYAPIYAGAYGSAPSSFSTYGWIVDAKTVACHIGSTNSVTNLIQDNSLNGQSFALQNSVFNPMTVFDSGWTGSVSGPTIGNGSILAGYATVGTFIEYTINITFGSTTVVPTGVWQFNLPFWMAANFKSVGTWAMYKTGIGWITGTVVLTGSGSTNYVSLIDSSGAYITNANPASIPAGSTLNISLSYLKG